MVDIKTITEQVQDVVPMAQNIAAIGEPMSGNFQASTIIGKLPPSWNS